MKRRFLVLAIMGIMIFSMSFMAEAQSGFFQNMSDSININSDIEKAIDDSSKNLHDSHGVEFYSIVLPDNNEMSIDDYIKRIYQSWDKNELKKRKVNVFVYYPPSEDYRLFLDDKIKDKLNKYMVDNIIQKNFNLYNRDVETNFKKTIPRMVDYINLALNADLEKSQFDLMISSIQNGKIAQEINFISPVKKLEEYEMQEKEEQENKESENENEKNTEEYETEEMDTEKSSGYGMYLIIGAIAILVLGLIIFAIIFIKKKNADYDNY